MVCTGNACRSPMAAAILQQRLAERGVDARVTSAGTMPWSSGATGPAVEVMREHGLDISGHENRQMTRELVEEADLVLGMTRDHVSIAIARSTEARKTARTVSTNPIASRVTRIIRNKLIATTAGLLSNCSDCAN